MKSRLSRKDVAAAAGVSETTVSVVLSGNASIVIAPETRARVLAVAERLGYRPNYQARAMASRKASAIGVLSPWDAEVWFFAQMLGGIRRAANARGYGIVLCNVLEEQGTPEDCIRYFREGRIDGAVYMPPLRLELPELQYLRRERIPTALCNGVDPEGRMDSVRIDYTHQIFEAASRLHRGGFTNLLYVMPDEEDRLCFGDRDRVRGFDEAASALPLVSAGKAVLELGDGREECVGRAAGLIAARGKPLGIVACYWSHAYYMALAATRLGLAQGVDFDVISGDCPGYTRALYPRFTGIELPFEEAGRRSAEMLIDRLEGRAAAPRQERISRFRFIE